jgi:nucleoside-diphosphate-sugar epimerase
MRRVLVLGGTGFVGRHVTAAFAAHGAEVVVVSRNPPASGVACDLTDASVADLRALLDTNRPDVVVDSTGSSWGLSDVQVTDRCTRLPERLVAALSGRLIRLVHLGSVLEHGDPPATHYGRAKAAGTAAVRAGAVDGVVLRLTNAVGPGLPRTSLLGRVAEGLCAVPPAVRVFPLTASRDYVDVRDVADAVVAAATAADAAGRVIDIGRGEAVPVRDLVRRLVAISGMAATVVEREEAGWRAVVDRTVADTTTAYEVLGWQAHRDLAGAVRDFWLEVVRHKDPDYYLKY